MKLVTLDFETAYSKDYTLSKLSLEEYVTDDSFQVLGVGVKVNDGDTKWYDGREPLAIASALAETRDSAILCQNTMFDGLILAHHYDIYPKFYFDTMLMAKPVIAPYTGTVGLKRLALHLGLGHKGDELENTLGMWLNDFDDERLARLGAYCINDVELTYKVFKTLINYGKAEMLVNGEQFGDFPQSELTAIDQTIRMFLQPQLQLDAVILAEAIESENRERDSVLQDVIDNTIIENQTQLVSNQQLADTLGMLGVAVPTKISPTTGKKTFAFAKTDQEFNALLTHPSGEVRKIIKARLRLKSNIDLRRAEKLQVIAQNASKLRVQLKYYGAHTGRFSGTGGINLQNLRRGSELRKAIVAPEGHLILACDLSQIEARITAWLANQYDLLSVFADETRDVYCEFATKIFGRKITKEDKVERFIGKTCILGLGYGMGRDKLAHTLVSADIDISLTDCQRYVHTYRNVYKNIPALWSKCQGMLICMLSNTSSEVGPLRTVRDKVLLPNGLYLTYPDLVDSPDGLVYSAYNSRGLRYDKKIYGGKVVENVVQALAQIIIKYHMAKIGVKHQIVLQVHDEILICVPAEEVLEAQAFMEEVMSSGPEWCESLPIACESSYGASYYDCKA